MVWIAKIMNYNCAACCVKYVWCLHSRCFSGFTWSRTELPRATREFLESQISCLLFEVKIRESNPFWHSRRFCTDSTLNQVNLLINFPEINFRHICQSQVGGTITGGGWTRMCTFRREAVGELSLATIRNNKMMMMFLILSLSPIPVHPTPTT